ncbi:hypothetical protein [Epilithonimonas hominis]|uniref:Uncharacterized protein n=1 Tax=Epilithonimonas hominis TaxID=420404 RepID=A0A1H6LKR7_9FLAO|nr:hypothetical protein [Epilithonimonas hominis]SEH86728.1 hypothetical protein SAMN05421793_14215 [Epilithonimonas hominis]HAP94388.1 hypothetical protein [Chryseobacterium sp.]
MKKLMIAGAFLMFGTLLMNAQTIPKKDNMRSKAEKNLKSTEMKMDTSYQTMEINKKDTFNLNQRQKIEDDKTRKRMQPTRDGLNNESIKPQELALGQLE